jgi:uncharacterized protein YjbJ (UPF0337 family)
MNVNIQTLKGNWNEIKGKLRERWGNITEDEWQRAQGNVEQLVGVIQRKTGEARENVMRYLEELTQNGGSMVGRARETVKEYARRPSESMAVCFGAGLLVGLFVGLTLRSR